MTTVHPLNWYAGWWLILAAFITGAGIGLFFHREDFWGGYASFRRRLVRLGHIALAALGGLNVLFSVATPAAPTSAHAASLLLLVGAVSMGPVCFLTGWRQSFRRLFFIPVTSLTAAVVLVLLGGMP
jgi:hypothetical protein